MRVGRWPSVEGLEETTAYKNEVYLLAHSSISLHFQEQLWSSRAFKCHLVRGSLRTKNPSGVPGSLPHIRAHGRSGGLSRSHPALAESLRTVLPSSSDRQEPRAVRELPQGPQGTTASTTPPFVRAGYDCRNNTTVWSRPEAVGWAPLVCAGPLTTSLRGLWVSGLLPPGQWWNDLGYLPPGKWPPATGQWWNERRGGDPRTDQVKGDDSDPGLASRRDCVLTANACRPEAVGWAPLVCAGLLTTSLRGLWVSGLLPPGNGGTCSRGGDPRTDQATEGADS